MIDKKIPSLFDVMVVGAELPGKVFGRPFENYLFFDADISSSQAQVSAVQNIVVSCIDHDAEVEVFASSDRRFLAHVGQGLDWSIDICRLGTINRKAGDAGGLILLDAKRRWVVYQNRPVDVGLLAINCNVGLTGVVDMEDYFFDCGNVSDWLERKNQRDVDLVKSFGAEFLAALIRNYN
ncbi:hypothetical protein M5C99_04110 [Acidovorax sp. NCPPB 2350]|nr:hypothetical protein M5C99_04110 [Acidovorax sp. NCPPB 2350]